MFCLECGTKLPEGSKFCNVCGKPTAEVPAQSAAPVNEEPDKQRTKLEEKAKALKSMMDTFINQIKTKENDLNSDREKLEEMQSEYRGVLSELGVKVTAPPKKKIPADKKPKIMEQPLPHQNKERDWYEDDNPVDSAYRTKSNMNWKTILLAVGIGVAALIAMYFFISSASFFQ